MTNNKTIKLEGVLINNLTYEQIDYYVFKGIHNKEKFTFVSTEKVIQGLKYDMTVVETKHPKYKNQYKVLDLCIATNLDENAIKICLQSYKNIGPAMAKKIYEKYGKDSLDVVEVSPTKLIDAGMSESKALETYSSIQENKYHKILKKELVVFNIPDGVQKRLYETYGTKTIDILNKNPYYVVKEIYGFTFDMADVFAITRKIVKENSAIRIKSAIEYLLHSIGKDGHTYLPAKELIYATKLLLKKRSKENNINDMDIKKVLVYMNREKLVEKKDIIIESDSAVYSKKYWFAENRIARTILKLLKTPSTVSLKKPFNELIEEVENEIGITYSENQKDAQEMSVTENIAIITGGPGTGKTTTINGVIKCIKKNDPNTKLLLVAPTGRAAQRMSETTGKEASTIHRMLEYKKVDGILSPTRDASNPIDSDVIIIDEASMVDIILFDEFLKAIKLGTRIIIVGDVDQLPSVGPGNVLQDLIQSKVIPTIRLDTIFRQAETSMIVVNAKKINNGIYPDLSKDDFKLRVENDEKIVSELIINRFVELYNSELSLDEIQVLSPYKRSTECGSNSLNKNIQERINPFVKGKPEIKVRSITFRVNDKVLYTHNNKEKDCYNGDVGYITALNPKTLEVTVKFDEKREIVFVGKEEIEELELAYACSIHKSQGSEYKTVLMATVMEHQTMLTKNLLYTGVTRAKQNVELYGSEEAIKLAISNKRTKIRHTKLMQRLRNSSLNAA